MLRSILKALQYSHLLTAVAALSFTIATYLILPLTANLAIVMLNFFGTLLIYNLQSLVYIAKPLQHETEAKEWQRHHKRFIWFLIFLSFLWLPALIKVFSTKIILMYALAAILAIFYYIPFLNLRRIPLLKNILLGLVWALVCVMIPIVQSEAQILPLILNSEKIIGLPILVLLYYCFSFFLITFISFWFDHRDISVDLSNGSKTFVNQSSDKNFLKYLVLVAALTLSALFVLFTEYWILTVGLFVYIFYLIILLRKKKLSFLAYGYWGDGLLIYYMVLLYIQTLLVELGYFSS
jgi:4-hydroxybenzoate polyprenyltransferase